MLEGDGMFEHLWHRHKIKSKLIIRVKMIFKVRPHEFLELLSAS